MMSTGYTHLSDEELLQFADGELASRQIGSVKEHLASCWDCRARLKQTEETIADFVVAQHEALDPRLPSGAGPRALLRARLAADAARQSSTRHLLPRSSTARTFAYAVAAVLLAILTIAVYRLLPSDNRATVRLMPDHELTPGVARAISTSDVCHISYSDDARLVSASTQEKVLQEYGIDDAQARNYELDYLISPQLGGTDDIRNLWPEPQSATEWNSRTKDALEERLHQLVCDGSIDLVTAQQDLANNWISAYKRYFHTNRPL
jgi:hypothetical protein